MNEGGDVYEATSVTSKTQKTSRFGTWGGRERGSGESRRLGLGDWQAPFVEWDSERGIPDGEKARERNPSSASGSRRLSDHSTASGGDRDVETGSTSSHRDADAFQSMRRRGPRARMTAGFMRDDFDERMGRMIREFDERCSRSLWDDEDQFFSRRSDDDDFFARSRISNNRFFQRPRMTSIFDDPFEDSWRESRMTSRDADSGIFSVGAQERRQSDDSIQVDKVLRQERRSTPEKFEVDIDVKGFKANELLVRTEGKRLIICAKTNNEEDANKSSRQFKREFDLPGGVNPYDVTSNLMPDGYLRVEAPVSNYAAYAGDHQQVRPKSGEPTPPRNVSGPSALQEDQGPPAN